MVRSPGTGASKAFRDAGGGSTVVMNKGPWTEAEDEILSAHVKAHGEGNWRLIPKLAGLQPLNPPLASSQTLQLILEELKDEATIFWPHIFQRFRKFFIRIFICSMKVFF